MPPRRRGGNVRFSCVAPHRSPSRGYTYLYDYAWPIMRRDTKYVVRPSVFVFLRTLNPI
jgi:hypothetical protein